VINFFYFRTDLQFLLVDLNEVFAFEEFRGRAQRIVAVDAGLGRFADERSGLRLIVGLGEEFSICLIASSLSKGGPLGNSCPLASI